MSEPAAKLPQTSPAGAGEADESANAKAPSSMGPVKAPLQDTAATSEVQAPPGVNQPVDALAVAREQARRARIRAKRAAAAVEALAKAQAANSPAARAEADQLRPAAKPVASPSAVSPAAPTADSPAAVPAPAADPAARTAAHAKSAQLVRRGRAIAFAVKVAIGVLLPTALAAVYYTLLASDIYESTALFTVQSADSRPSMGLDVLLGAAPSAATQDTLAVRDYVLSRDMLARLDAEHQFISDYKDASRDWVARLSADASTEDAYQYYLNRVFVEHDNTSGVTTLRIKAFSAERAKEFSEAILTYSEQMVNQLSERAREDQTRYAHGELDRAEKRLAKARQHVLELQGKHADFSPTESAQETLSIRGQLKAELAKVQAELAEARSYMAKTAPKVVALQQQAASLAGQIAGESRRLVNPKGESGLNTSIVSFEEAMLEKEFAQSAYQSALTSLELARADASRQHRYLARIAEPSIPDEATFPRRGLGILTVFVLSVAFMGIASLVTAAVREHARI